METLFKTVIQLESVDCCKCHHRLYMTSDFMAARKRDHQYWHCLACGANQHWSGESDLEKIRRERDAALQREETLRAQRTKLEADKNHLRRRISAANGQITKIKNRVSKGVCPCCNRTFENLQRHMATKHADYAAPSV